MLKVITPYKEQNRSYEGFSWQVLLTSPGSHSIGTSYNRKLHMLANDI